MPEGNAIYIPSAGLCCALTEAEFTQASVDTYDIVYSEEAYGGGSGAEKGWLNPFVLGHCTGSMAALHKTEPGSLIYLRVRGVMEAFRVFVSECAHVRGPRSIVGAATGAEVTEVFDKRTLHLYTCHPAAGQGGRWIVLARLVDSERPGAKVRKPLTFSAVGGYNRVNK